MSTHGAVRAAATRDAWLRERHAMPFVYWGSMLEGLV
jgi:hypothetical protein